MSNLRKKPQLALHAELHGELAREMSPSGRKTLFTVNEKCFAYRSLDTGDDAHIIAVIPPENAFKQFIVTTEGEDE